MMDLEEVLTQGYGLGQEHHPDAPTEHHASFANSVSYGVTGWSGGYGGPSMREHWANHMLRRDGEPGSISFDDAVRIVEEACYGPMTVEIAGMLNSEHCFDDTPGDLEEAMRLLQNAEKSKR